MRTTHEPPHAAGHPPGGAPEEAPTHLLDLARAAVVATVTGARAPTPDVGAHPELADPGDAFVTLTDAGSLRGCMGTLEAGIPVGVAIVQAAGLAAGRDPRFWPVAAGELARLRLEVSVLGPPRPLADPSGFVAGRDGIVVEARGRRALLLPQVATEMGWGATEMLGAVCEKAGLPADAWRDPAARLLVFGAARVAGPVVPAGVRPGDGPRSGLERGDEGPQPGEPLGPGEAGEGDPREVRRDRGSGPHAAVGGDAGEVEEDGAFPRPGLGDDVGREERGEVVEPRLEVERRDRVGHRGSSGMRARRW